MNDVLHVANAVRKYSVMTLSLGAGKSALESNDESMMRATRRHVVHVPLRVLLTADGHGFERESILRQCARLVRKDVSDLAEVLVDGERSTTDRPIVLELSVAPDRVHLQDANNVQRDIQGDGHHHLKQNDEAQGRCEKVASQILKRIVENERHEAPLLAERLLPSSRESGTDQTDHHENQAREEHVPIDVPLDRRVLTRRALRRFDDFRLVACNHRARSSTKIDRRHKRSAYPRTRSDRRRTR
jgi:hypothetical protein